MDNITNSSDQKTKCQSKAPQPVILLTDDKTFHRFQVLLAREDRRLIRNKQSYKEKREKQLEYKDTVRPLLKSPRQRVLVNITSIMSPEIMSQATQLMIQPVK